ncbi:MAG: NAD(P)-dependent oxidoreductase [Myxococcaceae bacterium]
MNLGSDRALRVCVVGASRGSGRATVDALLARGHEVVAFARNMGGRVLAPRLTVVQGDALNLTDVESAVQGCGAVVVTLGISENAVAVRLGIRHTPIDVRSRGTANVIAAMKHAGVRRLIVQSTYGIGESKGRLPVSGAIVFALLLAPQIQDHERQETLVRESGLDWTLVQPVGLVDAENVGAAMVSVTGAAKGMKVSRAQVAQVICDAVEGAFVRSTVAVS